MSLKIQAISSHPVLVRAIEEVLGDVKEYPYLPSVPNETEATRRTNFARLFLLDACSLQTDLGLLAVQCSASSPGSKFIALLPPAGSDDADKIRLLYCGIDGFVELSETWKTELPQAVRSVLGGEHWALPQVLVASVHEQTRIRRGKSLTAREGQILRLVMQRLTNKEISRLLVISERTVKFHVSNILAKLGLEDRRGLLPKTYLNRETVFQLGPAVRRSRGSKAELKPVSRRSTSA